MNSPGTKLLELPRPFSQAFGKISKSWLTRFLFRGCENLWDSQRAEKTFPWLLAESLAHCSTADLKDGDPANGRGYATSLLDPQMETKRSRCTLVRFPGEGDLGGGRRRIIGSLKSKGGWRLKNVSTDVTTRIMAWARQGGRGAQNVGLNQARPSHRVPAGQHKVDQKDAPQGSQWTTSDGPLRCCWPTTSLPRPPAPHTPAAQRPARHARRPWD
ncbi:hypothetical protein HDV64DRAFT_281512 [Trichoderma sp. TUCIM 5745]